MVGETAAFRAILMDPLTKKPEKLYGYFASIYGGTPTAFTMNGSGWHAKRRAFAPAFSLVVAVANLIFLPVFDGWRDSDDRRRVRNGRRRVRQLSPRRPNDLRG